jgi:diacylglycerol kinase family enzyme
MAGKGRSLQLQGEVKTACEARGGDYDVFISDGVENTCAYVRNIADALGEGERATFLACGGDGTICKTVLAVMALPREKRGALSVGVIPMGTGNDFVSNFANKELFSDIDAQIDGSTVEIDLLRCNELYSVNMINIGFDCHVVCKKESIGKKAWVPRKLAYIFALVFTLIKKPGVSLSISHDGNAAEDKKLLLTTFANGAYCGGGRTLRNSY